MLALLLSERLLTVALFWASCATSCGVHVDCYRAGRAACPLNDSTEDLNCYAYRLPGDKIDVWLCRYNGLGPANFWGFKQLSYRYCLPETGTFFCRHSI